MTKNNKYIGGGLLVLLLILAFVFRKQIKEKVSSVIGKKSPDSTTTTNTKKAATPTTTTLLKNGSRGDAVQELQILLNKELENHPTIDLPPLVEDGIFGPKTEAMLSAITGKRSISVATFIKEHTNRA